MLESNTEQQCANNNDPNILSALQVSKDRLQQSITLKTTIMDQLNQLLEKLREDLGKVLSKKLIIFFAGKNDAEKFSEFIPNIEITDTIDLQVLLKELKFEVYTEQLVRNKVTWNNKSHYQIV